MRWEGKKNSISTVRFTILLGLMAALILPLTASAAPAPASTANLSISNQDAGDPGNVFYEYCHPRRSCEAGWVYPSSSTDDSGTTYNEVYFYAGYTRHGRVLPVSFRFPAWMYCQYTDISGGFHSGYGDQIRIKRADWVACYWVEYANAVG